MRWKGYDESDDTWEPEENLRGCRDAILTFFDQRDAHAERRVRIAESFALFYDSYCLIHIFSQKMFFC